MRNPKPVNSIKTSGNEALDGEMMRELDKEINFKIIKLASMIRRRDRLVESLKRKEAGTLAP